MDGPGHSPQNQEQALSAIHQKKRSCLMSAVAGMMFAVQTNRGGSGISSVSAMLSVVPLSVVYIDGYGPYKSLCYLCEDAVLLCAVFTQEPLATASAACPITTATASLIFPAAVVMIPPRTVVVTINIAYHVHSVWVICTYKLVFSSMSTCGNHALQNRHKEITGTLDPSADEFLCKSDSNLLAEHLMKPVT